MVCKEMEGQVEELEELLEGRLKAERAAEIKRHVAGCAACREALAEAEVCARLLRGGLERAVSGGDRIWTGVAGRIRMEEARLQKAGEFWNPLEALALRLAWSAGLAVALLATYAATFEAPRRARGGSRTAEICEICTDPVQEPATQDEVLLSLSSTGNGR